MTESKIDYLAILNRLNAKYCKVECQLEQVNKQMESTKTNDKTMVALIANAHYLEGVLQGLTFSAYELGKVVTEL